MVPSREGGAGLFVVCLSSEVPEHTPTERVRLAMHVAGRAAETTRSNLFRRLDEALAAQRGANRWLKR